MQIKIQAFGIARDILQASNFSLELEGPITVKSVKEHLLGKFPAFADLASLRVAVNTEYAEDGQELQENDEIVLIPPVSGG
ncbi:MAG TPA: molybdopterin synthase sulfur carrier subunit [Cytophagales bacterium]|nr:molybdopterin synthase sulfur carrier subunit [Cytophagales bacterium]HAA18276.1 molybdopterin synthase sulfur carrier subunit [Cytophagales bacterium]HAP63176.1 molybdopterin synthase sulfur carrier subunit [Cytophagales bacterium]